MLIAHLTDRMSCSTNKDWFVYVCNITIFIDGESVLMESAAIEKIKNSLSLKDENFQKQKYEAGELAKNVIPSYEC